jgi:hypothetical protein
MDSAGPLTNHGIVDVCLCSNFPIFSPSLHRELEPVGIWRQHPVVIYMCYVAKLKAPLPPQSPISLDISQPKVDCHVWHIMSLSLLFVAAIFAFIEEPCLDSWGRHIS